MGGTFIAVVMFFPDGLAGLLEKIPTSKGKYAALLARFQKTDPGRHHQSHADCR